MNQTESVFLQNTVLAAQQGQRTFGVPASIILAQATLESGWGQSALARQANNYFGIKANANADPGQYVQFETTEFVDGRQVEQMAKFARYTSPLACFHAHAYLLSMALRYRPAMAVKNDPAAFAQALQDCGYSTSPTYAAELMQIVKQFDLTQYDIAEANSAATPGAAATPTFTPSTAAKPAAPAATLVPASSGAASAAKVAAPGSKAVAPAAPAKVKQ